VTTAWNRRKTACGSYSTDILPMLDMKKAALPFSGARLHVGGHCIVLP
jgi:hypothetical protein